MSLLVSDTIGILVPYLYFLSAEFLNDGPEEISFLSIDWVDGWNSIIDESLVLPPYLIFLL